MDSKKNKKVISIIYNTSYYVVKFRLELIRQLRKSGYEVVVIAPKDEYTQILRGEGIEVFEITMSQYGMNPFSEIKSLYQIYTILRKIKPVVTLNYTVKPNTFGSIAANFSGVPVINNIAGAGSAFSSGKRLQKMLVSVLYYFGLRGSFTVFFQNSDDMKLFLKRKLVRSGQCHRLPGSGVDVRAYRPLTQSKNRKFVFLFVGRLLLQKGIKEYLLAANSILSSVAKEGGVEFHVVGEHEDSNAYITEIDLKRLTQSEKIIYHGAVNPSEIRDHLANSNCVVLPTYYGEGVPRVLLEAIASARPIISTDNAGSRDVVVDGVNGFMIPPRDEKELRAAMQRMMELSVEEREEMGKRGREKAEQEFDEKIVISRYLEQISKL